MNGAKPCFVAHLWHLMTSVAPSNGLTAQNAFTWHVPVTEGGGCHVWLTFKSWCFFFPLRGSLRFNVLPTNMWTWDQNWQLYYYRHSSFIYLSAGSYIIIPNPVTPRLVLKVLHCKKFGFFSLFLNLKLVVWACLTWRRKQSEVPSHEFSNQVSVWIRVYKLL